MPQTAKYTVEVCFSPKLYEYKLTKNNFIVVIVDILRASTSICAAFDHGVSEIIPVAGVEAAREYKDKGYIVACERDGKVLDFADAGNSPSDFLNNDFVQKTVAYSTTNGTKAIRQASDAEEIVIGSFANLNSLAGWLKKRNKNIVIFCAAWKNLFNLEDSVFAGALSEILLHDKNYYTECDSVKAGIDLWEVAKKNLPAYLGKSSHRNRLRHLVSESDYRYTVTLDSTGVIPHLERDVLVDISK